MAPLGTRVTGTPNPDYWTFEPAFAVSYLSGQWNLTANFFYDINTKSQGICCNVNSTITSGNALYGDLHALYKFGKWEIGPVGYFEVQTTSDPAPAVLVRLTLVSLEVRCAPGITAWPSVAWLATISARSSSSLGNGSALRTKQSCGRRLDRRVDAPRLPAVGSGSSSGYEARGFQELTLA